MEDTCSYFRKWREWRNGDLGSKPSTSIKGAEEVKAKESQSINQSTIQQINRLNVNQHNVNQQILAFNNFSILIPSVSQVSDKFSAVLFYSFVVKSKIFSSNSSILLQVLFKFLSNFQHNTVFTVKSNVYFSNSSILVASTIQVYQLSAPCYFIIF